MPTWPPSKRTWILGAAGAGAVAIALAIAVPRLTAGPSLKYDTAQADRGPIVAKVTATGTLSALVTVQVGSQVSGRVAQLFADFNSQVHKGQLLAKIDPQLFQAALDQARASADAAEGNLAKARVAAADATLQAARQQQLAARKLVAQADADTARATAEEARAAVEAAKGQVEQAQANLHQAEVNLAYTTITSPIDGTVVSRNVDVGQTVAASLQAPTLFVLAQDMHKLQIDTSVAESDIGKLKSGMGVKFTVDAYPGQEFDGEVRQVRNSPQTVQNVVTYDAVVDVANPDLTLKPGMTANVTFAYDQREDALRVPNAALRFRPPAALLALSRPSATGTKGKGHHRHRGGGGASAADPGDQADAGVARGKYTGAEVGGGPRVVWVLRGKVPAPVKVVTGLTDGTETEVVQGDLHPGDALVTDASNADGSVPAGPSGGGSNPGRGMKGIL